MYKTMGALFIRKTTKYHFETTKYHFETTKYHFD
jgi:hypothetical protein